jgi:cell division protein FtsQ
MRQVSKPQKSSRRSASKPARRDTRKTTRSKAPAKPVRKTARKSTKGQVRRENFGRRTDFRDDIFARTGRWLREKLTFRRPVLYLTGTVLALVLVAALFAGGYVHRAVRTVNGAAGDVAGYAGLSLSKLHLSGENRVSAQTILAVAGFRPGQSIFDADLRMARARLMQLPWVADAVVARRYPDSITVHIVEKHPFAVWKSAKGLYVIERSGKPIVKTTLAQFPKLPVFAGDPPKGGADLIEAIAANRAVAARVRIMQRVGQRRWNLILDDGVVVKLPETGWKQQIKVLEHLIVDKGVLERNIRAIDLRSKDNYFFELPGKHKPQQVRREHAA